MSERASARVWGRRETLPRFQTGDGSELFSAQSLAPGTWEQIPGQAGDIMAGKSCWVHSKEVDCSASKAAAARMGGSGRGPFGLLLELFVELEENV